MLFHRYWGRQLRSVSSNVSNGDRGAPAWERCGNALYLNNGERATVGKLQDCQVILKAFGLPIQQQNEASSYTLLALAGLEESTPWASAQKRLLRIHDIKEFINHHYQQTYAENTRESFRKNVLRQFVHSAIVDRNADEPSRPVNSGNTCYSLTDEALEVIRQYGRKIFSHLAAAFVEHQGSLADKYAAVRKKHAIVVPLPSGLELKLSAGSHNRLQAQILKFFWRILCRRPSCCTSATRKTRAFM